MTCSPSFRVCLAFRSSANPQAGVFDETLRFLVDYKVSLVKFFTPAPYPGTAYHEGMRQAGRILNEDGWRCDDGALLVQPTEMDAGTLRSGFDRTYKYFYGLPAVAKRMLALPWRKHAGRELAAYLVANLKTWHFLKKNPSAWGTLS